MLISSKNMIISQKNPEQHHIHFLLSYFCMKEVFDPLPTSNNSGYKKISKQLGEKLTTVGAIIREWKQTQSHRQSPSVWGSTQDLASWDINDDGKGQGSAQYYTGGAC